MKKHHHPSVSHYQDPFVRRIGNDAHTDWLIMLISGALLVAVFVIFGYITYRKSAAELSQPMDTASLSHRMEFDPRSLADIITQFDRRVVERGDIMRGAGIIGDPSI